MGISKNQDLNLSSSIPRSNPIPISSLSSFTPDKPPVPLPDPSPTEVLPPPSPNTHIGRPHKSSNFDAKAGIALSTNFLKLVYPDNEWGYSSGNA
ncbi:hypothetical protein BUALT_Bualt03G0020300 [Buddleja alternifolia]|uniref:Uncharacterized protein n=1 Tax=Buddleja alternifolia TaxID=168488 RepID=A0AAV6XSN6_9LAMI|nr:hypothetical protein BUALT_Bualt03G0020300 [Buddleja alternifolia]